MYIRNLKLIVTATLTCALVGCGSPKCGSSDTKSVFDLALVNAFRTELSQGLLSPVAPTYDSLEQAEKDQVEKQITPLFPAVLSQIVEVSKTDNTAACTGVVTMANGKSMSTSFSVSKTEDGMLQVIIQALQ